MSAGAMSEAAVGPKPVMIQATLPLPEGEVIFLWPKTMTKTSFQNVKAWLDIMLGMAEAAIQQEQPCGKESNERTDVV